MINHLRFKLEETFGPDATGWLMIATVLIAGALAIAFGPENNLL